MQIEITNQECDYLLGVLTQRPLGEAYAMFEKMKGYAAEAAAEAAQRTGGPRLVQPGQLPDTAGTVQERA